MVKTGEEEELEVDCARIEKFPPHYSFLVSLPTMHHKGPKRPVKIDSLETKHHTRVIQSFTHA